MDSVLAPGMVGDLLLSGAGDGPGPEQRPVGQNPGRVRSGRPGNDDTGLVQNAGRLQQGERSPHAAVALCRLQFASGSRPTANWQRRDLSGPSARFSAAE